ncbi:FISUMP domain-containing protein [Salinivirga cyanobacteriivorans]
MLQKHNLLTMLMLALVSTLLIFTACEKDEDDDPATDSATDDPTNEGIVTDIDGNVYSTVQIGDQVWMAENLKTTTYNDGTSINLIEGNSYWGNDTLGAYCWKLNSYEHYADAFGAIYNWYVTINGNLCPDGWHLPTDAEWTALENYIANDGYDGAEGYALKSTSGWHNNGGGNDNYGFAARPTGFRFDDGEWTSAYSAYFWTATEGNAIYAYYRSISQDSTIYREWINKHYGFFVRCLKD